MGGITSGTNFAWTGGLQPPQQPTGRSAATGRPAGAGPASRAAPTSSSGTRAPATGCPPGANVAISSASGVGAAVPPTTRASKAMRHDGRLEPRVQADDLARLDEQPGLLQRLADRRLVDRLVDLEEAARLRPCAAAGLDAAAQQDDLAVVGDREAS